MKATGLVKASLYHRFPGGKADMVNAILSEVDRQFAEYVVKPAFEEGEPQVRARKIARRLREFYRSGKQWCLLDTARLPTVLPHAHTRGALWNLGLMHSPASAEMRAKPGDCPQTFSRSRSRD